MDPGANAGLGGDDVMLLSNDDEITISTTYETRGAIQIPRKYDFEKPGDPNPGEAYFSRNSATVQVWDGDNWRTLRYL